MWLLKRNMMISGLPWWLSRYRICLQCGRPGFNPWVGKIPRRRAQQPTPVLLPEESHRQRSLVGYSPWGCNESESCSVLSDSLQPHGLYSPWNSPGQNTGVGSLSLLWGIFPTQGLNPGLLHCRQILHQLNYQGSPKSFFGVTELDTT